MGRISKTFALFLTLTILMSCLTLLAVKSANAQTNTPVPEFSIKFVDGSYDVPANTSIDPFTGQTVTIPAQHINNQTIIVTIKNQTMLYEENYLNYQIQMKGYYSQEWTNISVIRANPHSQFTVVTYAIDGNNASGQFDDYLNQISSGSTVDFRVQAQIWVSATNPQNQMQAFWMGAISDWSPTLTITLTDGATSSFVSTSPTPNQSPTPTPTVPELSWLVIVPLLLSVLSIAVIIRHRKTAV